MTKGGEARQWQIVGALSGGPIQWGVLEVPLVRTKRGNVLEVRWCFLFNFSTTVRCLRCAHLVSYQPTPDWRASSHCVGIASRVPAANPRRRALRQKRALLVPLPNIPSAADRTGQGLDRDRVARHNDPWNCDSPLSSRCDLCELCAVSE